MYSFYIKDNETKKFMNLLLKESTFDRFECCACELTTLTQIKIDGRINKDFYEEKPNRYFCLWAELKPIVFFLVKGKKLPKHIKIVLMLSESACQRLHPNGKSCFLNITFKDGRLLFVTGTAQREFSPDRELDTIWDNTVKRLFAKLGLDITEI